MYSNIDNKSKENKNDISRTSQLSNHSDSSSISQLGTISNPTLHRTISFSCIILIITSFSTFVFALRKDISLLYDFSDSESNKFITTSNLCISLPNLIIGFSNILLLTKLSNNQPRSFIHLINTVPKYNLPILNFLISFLYILPLFLHNTVLYHNIIFVLISGISLQCIALYYKKLRMKKRLDVYSVITIKRYTSMILAIMLYTLMFYIGKLVVYVFPFNKSNTVISFMDNLIQFLFGIVLISYYHDVAFIIVSVFFIYVPALLASMGSNAKTVLDVVIFIFLGFIITCWKLYKTKKSILGRESKPKDDILKS